MPVPTFHTFADFIGQMSVDERKALSKVCRIEIGTTYVWANRNDIPRDKWPDIQTAYGLALEKLYAMEAASAAAKASAS